MTLDRLTSSLAYAISAILVVDILLQAVRPWL